MASAHIWTLGILFTVSGLRAQSVTQPEAEVPVAEGDPVTVKCTYSVSWSPYLFWYVQHRNQSLQFLLKYIGGDTLVKGSYGFEAEFNKSQTSFHLKKPSVLGSDSALYFCAVSDRRIITSGANQLVFGTGTSLTILPQIKDPNPTVYQLRSPQSSDTSVCLFTDFDSNQVNMTQIMGSEGSTVHKTKSTVLNMEILGSKSNGIVTWENNSNAGCADTFNETIHFAPSFDIPCNAKLVEKSFETDINLNSQNLSVIVFRMLLLKVVGFNLLMTLRLWSS